MRRFLPVLALALISVFPATQASASTPPAAPVLVQSAATSATATFTWTAPSSPAPITRFELRRNGTLIAANLSSSLTSYTFNSLAPDSTSTVLLRACSSFGCSPDSAPLTLGTAPAAPSSRIDVAAPGSIKSSWLSTATTHVWYKTAAATTWVEWTPGVPDTNPTTITGLTNGVPYVVRIEARNAYGSTFTPVSTSQTPRDVPSKPVLTFARATTSSITLSWTPPATNGSSITSYAFFRDGTQVATTGSVGSYTFTGLTPGSSYAFTAQACNAIGCSAGSDVFTASPLPSASTSVSVLPRDGSMDLSWTAATGATAYKVFYRPSASTTWIEWTPGSPDTSPTSITGLLNGTPYAFAVAAVNSSGSSTLTTASGTPRGAPGAPVLSLSSPPTTTSAPLTWTLPAANGSTITSFKVYRNATLISTTSGRTLTSSGLPAGSAQSYYVEACNAAGCTASNTLNVQLPPAAPSVSATRSNQSITLSWSTPTGSTAVAAVWYKLSTATTWIEWTPGTAETSPATITGLTNGTAYHAKVVLTTSAGSAESSTLTAIPVGPPGQAPAAPTFPFMSASTVGLAWPTPVDTGGLPLSSFRIYRNGTLVTTTSGSARSFTATALASGSWHSFQIEACNSAGCSPISSDGLAATFALPPTSLAASSHNGSLVLSWTNSTGNAVSGYAVQYTESTTTPWVQLDALAASSPATVTNLTGRTYFVRVCAVDQAGNRCTGTVQVVRVAQDYTPPPPRSLVASPLNGSVSLAWLAPASNPGSTITDYVIEYRLSSSTTWTVAVDGSSTATSTTITGLTNGSAYQFRVSAINAAGTGAPSTTITSTPRTTPSQVESVSFGAVGAKSIQVFWSAPSSDGGASISEYRLYRNGSLVATLPPTPRIALDDFLKPGTLYFYQIEAVNVAGPSPISTAFGAPTLPDSPYSVVIHPHLSESVIVYWDEVPNQVVDLYAVFYRPVGGKGKEPWTEWTPGTADISPTIVTGLTNGTAYEIMVAAINASGATESTGFQVIPRTNPSEPLDPQTVPGDGLIHFSWSPPINNGGLPVADYEVEYSADWGSTWSMYPDGISASTSATVTGLVNGTEYILRVRASNNPGFGSGIDSAYAYATPRGAPEISYGTTAFDSTVSFATLSPDVVDGSDATFSISGPLPNDVEFNTSTGVFTGPSTWNFKAVDVAATGEGACALDSDGMVHCWGELLTGRSYVPLQIYTDSSKSTPLDQVSDLVAGSSHYCALRSGEIWCWGYNNFGGLGNGTTTSSAYPVKAIGISNAVSIDAGFGHTCAILADDSVRCWGWNSSYQLGDGTMSNRSTPVEVLGLSGTAPVSLALGLGFSCALQASGSVLCWGSGENIGTYSPRLLPGMTSIKQLDAGMFHLCGTTTGGAAKCFAQDSSWWSSSAATYIEAGVSFTAAGMNHSCATLTDGTAKCWGGNNIGQLGDGSTTNRSEPVEVSGLIEAVAIQPGFNAHTCSLLSDGMIKCWGNNGGAQLGTGLSANSLTPTPVKFTGPQAGFPAQLTVTITTPIGSSNTTVTLTAGPPFPQSVAPVSASFLGAWATNAKILQVSLSAPFSNNAWKTATGASCLPVTSSTYVAAYHWYRGVSSGKLTFGNSILDSQASAPLSVAIANGTTYFDSLLATTGIRQATVPGADLRTSMRTWAVSDSVDTSLEQWQLVGIQLRYWSTAGECSQYVVFSSPSPAFSLS